MPIFPSIWCWTTMPPTRPRKFGRGSCGILGTTCTSLPRTVPGSTKWSAGSPHCHNARSNEVRTTACVNWNLPSWSSSRCTTSNPNPLCGPRVPMRFSTALDGSLPALWLHMAQTICKKSLTQETSFFTPEIRADVDYNYSFNHPKDDTIGGSSEVFRHGEVQVTQLGVGGDFHYDNVRARLMTQFGLYSQTTPRNDASPARGQWQLDNAYRDISEAYGGYHFNALHGINVDAGIFMSYIGLFSYYQFDNWAYQPSYVSSNTPWFFNGVRV